MLTDQLEALTSLTAIGAINTYRTGLARYHRLTLLGDFGVDINLAAPDPTIAGALASILNPAVRIQAIVYSFDAYLSPADAPVSPDTDPSVRHATVIVAVDPSLDIRPAAGVVMLTVDDHGPALAARSATGRSWADDVAMAVVPLPSDAAPLRLVTCPGAELESVEDRAVAVDRWLAEANEAGFPIAGHYLSSIEDGYDPFSGPIPTHTDTRL